MVDGKPARSPDHYAVTTPAAPNGTVTFNMRRSKGYEGMAASPDGRFLYALLEGPVWDAEQEGLGEDGRRQGVPAHPRIRRAGREVDRPPLAIRARAERSRHRRLQHDQCHDRPDHRARQRRGHRRQGLPAGRRSGPTASSDLAKFKRIYKIELSDANVGAPVRKIGYIDLMQIADPNKKAQEAAQRQRARPSRSSPSRTWTWSTTRHIVVGNDNNLPFSSSREPNKQDDNEFVLLEVGDFLKAK